MQLTRIAVDLVIFVTLALAAPTTPNDLPYPVQVVQYTGFLGGYEVQLNGTVQEMYAQMQILHPDFNPDAPGFAPGFEDKNLTSRSALNKVIIHLTHATIPVKLYQPTDGNSI